MILVLEHWQLKPGLEDRALEVLQEMEDLLGPAAHAHPGWCDHARFMRSSEDPHALLVLYPWRNHELLEDLLAAEEPRLRELTERCFARPRRVEWYEDLPVDVEVETSEKLADVIDPVSVGG